ncbi:MAG: thioredoxin family protein [bacterium]
MKVLKIGAVWCLECRIMKPRWHEIEAENPNLKTEFLDYDENPDIIKKYNITEMPSFIFLDSIGNEIERVGGDVPKQKLIDIIKRNIDK